MAKNHIHDANEILRIYKQELNGEKFVSTLKDMAEKHGTELDNEMAAIASSGIRMVFFGEQGYPKALEELPDAPVMLFVRSETDPEELFNSRHICKYKAVVGTRDMSPYGKAATEKIVSEYRRTSPSTVFVSGLAIGIDTTAHKSALAEGFRTIAVLPTGLDTVYPNCNRKLAETIAGTPGCALVSPFAPGTAPEPVNFLLRNRVIAGLCLTTIVVESKAKGGALVTARAAFSYGRKVYAVPGRIEDYRSEGCNALIQEGTAELLTF